ncbi:MAG: HAD-IB family hydrolase [Casimicrobium sp.]
MKITSARPKLTLFDLDNTLLSGDSDVLWCDFLVARRVLDSASFSVRNVEMDARYRAGTVTKQEFSEFYVGTLAGRTPGDWESLRQEFLATEIIPRVPLLARARVRLHLDAGDLVVMTTATNRFITELTARYLNIENLIATEPELREGKFSGRTEGTLNMRDGKVVRLHAWLAARGAKLADYLSTAYSDSINDLPLLQAVNTPVAVDPDDQLAAWARQHGHLTLSLR